MEQPINALVTIPEIVETSLSTFPKIPSDDKYCNGKVHRQERYCHRPAGWGTSHPGEGRCKLHGGCSTGPKSGELRYSDFVPSALQEKYEEFAVESDVDVKSLDNEIALIRAKVALYEQSNQTGTDIQKSYNDKMILNLTELIRRLVETKQKVEEGVKSKVTIEVVVKTIDAVIVIIDNRVTDLEVKRLIALDMKHLNIATMGFVSQSN